MEKEVMIRHEAANKIATAAIHFSSNGRDTAHDEYWARVLEEGKKEIGCVPTIEAIDTKSKRDGNRYQILINHEYGTYRLSTRRYNEIYNYLINIWQAQS